MARRKRLTPAQTGYLDTPADPDPDRDPAQGLAQGLAGLETKAWTAAPPIAPPPVAPPPIAQVAGTAAATAALAEVSAVLSAARREGRLVSRLPLGQIDAGHLVRDRMGIDEAEMAALMASLRAHGQRTPIEVTPLGADRYGLISGWRRVTALARLSAETQDPRFATVLALLRQPETAAEAYVAMVEENEIRLGLSYYERARIVAKAVERGVFATEKQALQRLFAAASRARRSKIGSFLAIHRALGADLRFPAALPERLGLALAQALEAETGAETGAALAERIRAALAAAPPESAAAERALLAAALAPPRAAPAPAPPPAAAPVVEEIRPGLFLTHGGGWTRPVLTLSGPAVDPVFRERLLHWLTHG